MPEPPIIPSTALVMLTPPSRETSYASFSPNLEWATTSLRAKQSRVDRKRLNRFVAEPVTGCASRRPVGSSQWRHEAIQRSKSGGLPQLTHDHPFKRLDRLEIFRRDLVLRNREVEFGFNAQHQIDHVHRGQTDIDEPGIGRNFRIDLILLKDRLDQRDDAIADIGVKTLHLQNLPTRACSRSRTLSQAPLNNHVAPLV